MEFLRFIIVALLLKLSKQLIQITEKDGTNEHGLFTVKNQLVQTQDVRPYEIFEREMFTNIFGDKSFQVMPLSSRKKKKGQKKSRLNRPPPLRPTVRPKPRPRPKPKPKPKQKPHDDNGNTFKIVIGHNVINIGGSKKKIKIETDRDHVPEIEVIDNIINESSEEDININESNNNGKHNQEKHSKHDKNKHGMQDNSGKHDNSNEIKKDVPEENIKSQCPWNCNHGHGKHAKHDRNKHGIHGNNGKHDKSYGKGKKTIVEAGGKDPPRIEVIHDEASSEGNGNKECQNNDCNNNNRNYETGWNFNHKQYSSALHPK